jgi:excisionase family DNA binding protein
VTISKKIVRLQGHPDPFVTPSALAEYWRVSRKYIHRQLVSGEITAIRLGPRSVRISTKDAVEFEERWGMKPG